MVGTMVRSYCFQKRDDGDYDVTVNLVMEPFCATGTLSRNDAKSFDISIQRIGVLGWRRPQYQFERDYLITDLEDWNLTVTREGYYRRFFLDGYGQYPENFEKLRSLVERVGEKIGVPRAYTI
ncbi:hypothetical protein [Atopobium sp. oral taxon 810]|uniref:hypothetical protein n=1 Tax=Atopobium sp. oral taxon 810 TaxID=712158 RepID=UPI0018DE1DBA|nr:hypothetical protein [Atopobium sp. oral taxon 810]